MGYVLAGYGVTLVSMAAYAAWVVLKGRRLAQTVEEQQR
jgi:heme exporter protein CcmD